MKQTKDGYYAELLLVASKVKRSISARSDGMRMSREAIDAMNSYVHAILDLAVGAAVNDKMKTVKGRHVMRSMTLLRDFDNWPLESAAFEGVQDD